MWPVLIVSQNTPVQIRLTIAANKGLVVKSGDIKSAFLQGMDMQRRLFVKPPPEAGLHGKLWLLKKGTYGISDVGRLFNLRLVKELKQLGMDQVRADGKLFSFVKDGKLQGLIVSHVDDLLLLHLILRRNCQKYVYSAK